MFSVQETLVSILISALKDELKEELWDDVWDHLPQPTEGFPTRETSLSPVLDLSNSTETNSPVSYLFCCVSN